MSVPTSFSTMEDTKLEERRVRPNSNPRYKTFNQFFYTAGDLEQFQLGLRKENDNKFSQEVSQDEEEMIDVSIDYKINVWSKNRRITHDVVFDTFQHIYHKYKKALYIRITNNKLDVFLPFSNPYFYNQWGSNLSLPPGFKNYTDFLMMCDKRSGFRTQPKDYHPNPHNWYANNSLVRTENPIKENDKGLCAIYDLLSTLCSTRRVPDIELFINKRDYPIMKRNDTESYEAIYGPECKIQHLLYDKYYPILSSVTTDAHGDIPIPTIEDWVRARNQEDGRYFAYFNRDYRYDFSTPWEDRKHVAVFRGSSTGTGITPETNPRLKLSLLSKQYPEFLDAGITKWCLRPRKIMGVPYLQTIDPKVQEQIGTVDKMDPYKQSQYKYIVNVDGHVSAFRLSLELSMGSVVLLVNSPYKMWYHSLLQPGVHYIPVQSDLSDLMVQILWCLEHDAECKIIAENARTFYNRYLQKEGILTYLQQLFYTIKREIGPCFPIPTTLFESIEIGKSIITPSIHERSPITKQIFFPSNRNIYALEGLYDFLQSNEFGYGEEKEIYQGSHGKLIRIWNIFLKNPSFSLLLKKPLPTSSVLKDQLNEVHIGTKYINTRIMKRNKHFRYTFYHDPKNGNILFEYIDGITYLEYLQGFTFTSEKINELLTLLQMISLALATAQEECCFVHNDLYPWNIIIKRGDNHTYSYLVKGQSFRIQSQVEPILIDYGKSTVDVIEFSRDPFCLLICTIYYLIQIKQKESERDKFILDLFHFFEPSVSNMEEVYSFVERNKKFTVMSCAMQLLSYRVQYEIKQLFPFQLFQYLQQLQLHNHPNNCCKIQTPLRITELYHPKECYIHLIKNSIHGIQDWFQQFITIIREKILGIIQNKKNNWISWYVKVMTLERIRGSLHFIKEYLPKSKTEQIQMELIELERQIVNIKTTTTSLSIPPFEPVDMVSFGYTSSLLSNPSKILLMIQRHSTVRTINKQYILQIKKFISSVLLLGTSEYIPPEYMNVLEWNTASIEYLNQSYMKMIQDCRVVYPKWLKQVSSDTSTYQLVKNILDLVN